ncbi:MAG: hypothetical protein IT364_21960 [Candidatus Hydrogenedentes bacterium]|nr:hypothetical protein [Candidatus Hydrogenedentota bacterium]
MIRLTAASKSRIREVFLAFLALAVLACPSQTPDPEPEPEPEPQPTDTWRSALYPEDWTPGFTDTQGRFLHDFSYAGYHYGEETLPEVKGMAVFNAAKDFGADKTGVSDSTAAIQAAIDAAEVDGGVVFLPTGLYRCDGVLTVNASGVVIRGNGPANTRLYFTKSEGMAYSNHITFKGAIYQRSDVPLAQDAEARSFDVRVNDASDLNPGDEISVGWVITDAFVEQHGMSGFWQAFNGTWRPFFRRTIVDIDRGVSPVRLILDVPLRYPALVRDSASVRRETGYITESGIEDLAVSNAVAWDAAWDIYQVHAIMISNAADCWVRNIESFASPYEAAGGYHLQSGGIAVVDSKRITVAECVMQLAQNRGTGGSGYLFEISRGNEILIRDCTGLQGRHNFIQNWDFGTTGCVFLRCYSSGSTNVLTRDLPIGVPAYCEYHHSLATACLVDQCLLEDGWYAGNRKTDSSGAGHTSTQCVFWNTGGAGDLLSFQYGTGYIVGTESIKVKTSLGFTMAEGSAPADYVEGQGKGSKLEPQSLYEDQLARRLQP